MANSSFSKSNLVGGQFQDASGNRLSNGYLVWILNHDSNIQTLGGPTGIQVAAGVPVKIRLDSNGNAVAGQYLWTNDVLTPAGSYYTVRLYDDAGLEVWSAPQVFYLTYSATLDLGSLSPLVP